MWQVLIPIITKIAGRNSPGLQKLSQGLGTAKEIYNAINANKSNE